jgi:hypothetical protein
MKTKIEIEIETEFRKFGSKDYEAEYDETDIEYMQEQCERELHEAIFKSVSEKLEGDGLEGEVIERMKDEAEYDPLKYGEFSDLGGVVLRIAHVKKDE